MKKKNIYTVRCFEMDADYLLKPYHIAAYFQDATDRDFEDYGIASFQLKEKDCSWIVSDLRIDYTGKMPRWRTNVNFYIWNRKSTDVRILKDFIAFDEDENEIARGTSSWVIINEKSRKPERVSKFTDDLNVHDEEAFPDYAFSKIIFPECDDYYLLNHTVRSYDVDFNNHLNNVRYIAGALETIPVEERTLKRLKSIRIKYINEAYYNQKLVSKCVKHNGSYLHCLKVDGQEEKLCKMISEWED